MPAADGDVDPVNGDAGPKEIGDAGFYDGPPISVGLPDASTCPGDGGMVALTVGGTSYCIDATEVTNQDYSVFVAANVSFSTQLPECSWNTNWKPNCNNAQTTRPEQPVNCIDWCDAYAYCKWAGKRLCGLVGKPGSPAAVGDYVSPTKSEWFAACSHGGMQKYAYGASAIQGACPSNDAPISQVATNPMCVGGFPGLHEMSGNVGEWENACTGATPGMGGEDDLCRLRGGDYSDDFVQQDCGQDYQPRRAARDTAMAIRCCADLR